jgi:hypothetical protein
VGDGGKFIRRKSELTQVALHRRGSMPKGSARRAKQRRSGCSLTSFLISLTALPAVARHHDTFDSCAFLPALLWLLAADRTFLPGTVGCCAVGFRRSVANPWR